MATMRRAVLRQAPAGALCLLLTLAGCTPTATNSTVHRPTATSTLAVSSSIPLGPRPSPVTGLLNLAPADCASGAPPQTFTATDFGGGFSGSTSFRGDTPAWELGLGGGTLHLNEYVGVTPYPSTKVMWVVGPNYVQSVVLAGHEVRTGAPLWFQIYPSNSVATDDPDALTAYTTRAVLDPAAPNRGSADNSSGRWNIWGIGIVVLAAGCYELDIASAEGGWRTVFAAGR